MTIPPPHKHTNRLARETSPYLLQHAHNPVDWYPWGEEAFEAARREDKPIFLSIGYSTCYWCHVMERQCFENEAIAAQMNGSFINIKVDREERPDVDEVYMAATQLMTRQGGWPMSVWLTHDLKPFYTGTYFPPEPAHGRPSFPQMLDAIATAWREQRDELQEQADKVAAAVTQHLRGAVRPASVTIDSVQNAANQLLRGFDPEHGGFSGARGPKFPTPNHLAFLLAIQRNGGDADIWNALHLTLDRMARGGMFDQVGGGFHRYSVDEKWLVPHFEKMLYDNGQLAEVYCNAHRQAKGPHERRLYERIIRETCDYVLREMTDATGAFWSAQDAEVEAREGGNYVWTRPQVEAAIADVKLRELAVSMYGLDEGPNFTDPHHEGAEPVNVLYLPTPLEQFGEYDEVLRKRQAINASLKAVRDRRPQPATDDKVLCSWNGMMIAGLAQAGRLLGESRYIEAAARAADAVLRHMTTPDGGLLRTMRDQQAKIPAFLEDHAFFVHGCIELHRALPDGPWLGVAARYAAEVTARFGHEQGGYFDTLPDQADLFVRTRGTQDGAIPSGNSQQVHNLLDLYEVTREGEHLRRAIRDLRSFGTPLAEQGANMAHMAHAALRAIEAGASAALEERTDMAEATGPVRVSVDPSEVSLASGTARVTVTLDIAAGYHVNARDAGEGLIPTSIELAGGTTHVELEAAFPQAKRARYPFADAELSVYEGRLEVPVTLRKIAAEHVEGPLVIMVSYQACTEEACLAPQRVELPLRLT